MLTPLSGGRKGRGSDVSLVHVPWEGREMAREEVCRDLVQSGERCWGTAQRGGPSRRWDFAPAPIRLLVTGEEGGWRCGR